MPAVRFDELMMKLKYEGLESTDSVEKVRFSNWNISKLIVSSEPIHHVAWLFSSALIVAAWAVG